MASISEHTNNTSSPLSALRRHLPAIGAGALCAVIALLRFPNNPAALTGWLNVAVLLTYSLVTADIARGHARAAREQLAQRKN